MQRDQIVIRERGWHPARGLIRRFCARIENRRKSKLQVQRGETEESLTAVAPMVERVPVHREGSMNKFNNLKSTCDGELPHRVRLTASLFNNQNRYSFSKSAVFPVQTQIQYRWFKCLLSPLPAKVKDPIGAASRASQSETHITNELIMRFARVPFICFFRLQGFVNTTIRHRDESSSIIIYEHINMIFLSSSFLFLNRNTRIHEINCEVAFFGFRHSNWHHENKKKNKADLAKVDIKYTFAW